MTSVAQTTAGLSARIVVSRSDTFTLDLEVAIEPGTTAALLGPNGSGKSTTVDALAGIVPLDEGRIQLDGRVLDDPDAGRILFAGDTLSRRSIGRTDLPGGDSKLILKSIKDRLFSLDPDTLVITGHGPTKKIGDEAKSNPFVR